jgi:TP901 family phage tail tape measure protein
LADNFSFEALFKFSIQGAKAAGADVKQLVDRIEDLRSAGLLGDQAADKLSKSVIQAGNAADTAGKKVASGAQNFNSLRYQLQDASFALGAFGAAAGALSAAPFAVAIEFQKNFAQVARTSGIVGEELDTLRGKFIDLAQELPTSFADLSEIGALGGQLNIAGDELIGFTETVAKLTVASDLTTEAAGTALARIGQLTGTSGDFNALGSAIALVGVNSVATESQIVKTANNIASIGQQAGFSAPEIIGFAGALASLGVPPELSRGTLERTFTQIGKAVSSGGESLQGFADIADISADDFAAAFSPGGNSAGALQKFIVGLGGLQAKGLDARSALRELGITSVRDVPTLLKLAQNTGVLADALADAQRGFDEANELNRQFGIISETTASRILNLKNNFQVFLDAIGSNGLGVIDQAIDGLSDLLKILTDFANSKPLEGIGLDFSGGDILALGAGLTGLIAVFALVAAAAARVASGVIAMGQAMTALRGPTAIAASSSVAAGAGFGVAGAGAEAASVGVKTLGTALKALTFVGLVAAIPQVADALGDVIENFTGFDDSVEGSISRLTDFSDATGSLTDAVAASTGGIDRAIANITGHGIYQATTDIKQLDDTLSEAVNSGNAEKAAEQFARIQEAADAQGIPIEKLRKLFPEYYGALENTGPAAGTAADGVDGLTEAMEAAQTATNEAVQAVKNYNAELFANANSEAGFYQSQADAAALLANETFALTEATVAGGDGFNLQTASGRDAQKALLDLAQSGNELIATQKEAGGTAEELTAQYEENKAAVREVGKQFGLSGSALDEFVQKYVASPKDLIYQQKLEGMAGVQAALDAFYRNNNGRTLTNYLQTIDLTPGRQSNGSQIANGRGGAGGIPFAEGGYTGRGGKYEPAGTVHKGEYVVPKKYVNQSTGLPNADAFGKLIRGSMPSSGYASGGYVGGGSGVMELGPKSLQRLSGNVVNVLLDSGLLTQSVNNNNARTAQRGGGR